MFQVTPWFVPCGAEVPTHLGVFLRHDQTGRKKPTRGTVAPHWRRRQLFCRLPYAAGRSKGSDRALPPSHPPPSPIDVAISFGPCFGSQAERLDAFGDWLEEQELPEELRPRTEA